MRFRFYFAPVILFVRLAHADSLIEQTPFSELIKSDTTYASAGDVVSVEALLWQKYRNAAQDDSVRKGQHERRELIFGDKKMRFSLERKGAPTGAGYPVYIALHGGGGAPASVNDSQWQHMKVYYRDSVDNGIYIAPRGVTDTWDLHFREESYPLYDRLIENLIAYEGADPNRIYFLGFSAGGDGVYQVVPRMPDRFAAANMSAGHHNWIRFDNLLNTPFLLQVGERDSAYNRNRVAAENFVTLNNLASLHGGYVHDLFIHAQSGHNGWYDNDALGRNHPIISDPVAWLNGGRSDQISKDTNAVHWLNGYQRNNLPLHLIWDLSTRSMRSQTWGAHYANNAPSIKASRDLFYWLALDTPSAESGRIEATVNRAQNAIYLQEVIGVRDFTILLHRDMFDFERPVAVFFNHEKIAEVMPSAKLNVMSRSLLERGDKNLLFHDEIAIHLPVSRALVTSAHADAAFSYCSNGRCSLMSAEDFRAIRNFPLELNYTCKRDNQYALTFDDGPSDNLPAILEILARHHVKATFFVVGQNLSTERSQSLLQAAHGAGHQIANHSFTHRSLVDLSNGDIADEITSTQNAIIATLGDTSDVRLGSSIVRPPFGNIDPRVQEVFEHHKFTSVRWSSDRYDWNLAATDGDVVKNRVKQHLDFINDASKRATFHRSVIDINHDKSNATVSVLDDVIDMVKQAGFEFVTVSECLGL